jgi:hypothetical protein
MLPIQVVPSFIGISIQEISISRDMIMLIKINKRDHSFPPRYSSEVHIQEIYESLVGEPDCGVYFLSYKQIILFILEVIPQKMHLRLQYPKKEGDYIFDLKLNIDITKVNYGSQALRAAAEGFFVLYPFARIIAPVFPDRREEILIPVLEKAGFTFLQEKTDYEHQVIYSLSQANMN